MKELLLFVNPAAGNEEIRFHLMDVISRFTAAGYHVTCHPTQKRLDITEVISSVGDRYDLIVSCGGDGTLNETVTGLMALENRPTLGYIPAGTVNDFATSLHIPKNVPDAVTNIIEGTPFPVDMGGFNDKYFTYVAAFGAFTKASYATPHATKQVLGRAAYILESIRSLKDIRPIHVRVHSGDIFIEDDVIYGMISNATSVGGFKLKDDSMVKMDDGLNEIVLVKAPKVLADYNGMLAALLAQDFSENYFHVFQSDHVELEFDQPVPWTLDGEYGGDVLSAVVKNIPTPVKLMVPKH